DRRRGGEPEIVSPAKRKPRQNFGRPAHAAKGNRFGQAAPGKSSKSGARPQRRDRAPVQNRAA
ncbi:MAG TPA: hypothetical protein VKY54_00385, partial [Kiloniellales bacterium]|nr:hypothetical protein [Kiloniellales bacterium]